MAARRFATTRWTLVHAAGHATGADARAALDELCRAYWPPLYAFVRGDRRDRSPAESADLVQEFFTRILERGDIATLDRGRGRFRSWLLQSMRHFLANQHDHETTVTAGGDRPHLSIDAVAAEQLYQAGLATGAQPEALYLRRWAMTVVERALGALRAELLAEGAGDDRKVRQLDAITPWLLGDHPDGGYESAAQALGVQSGALRTAATRWRQLLRAEVAETLLEGEDVDAELQELMAALS